MYPTHSTTCGVSIAKQRGKKRGIGRHTEPSNDEWDKEPGPMAEELIEVDKGGDGEKDGEEDGCSLGWVVTIVCPDGILVVGATVCCLSSPERHCEC
jgi:hypothetical protein